MEDRIQMLESQIKAVKRLATTAIITSGIAMIGIGFLYMKYDQLRQAFREIWDLVIKGL